LWLLLLPLETSEAMMSSPFLNLTTRLEPPIGVSWTSQRSLAEKLFLDKGHRSCVSLIVERAQLQH
jgi:hypothetical protein